VCGLASGCQRGVSAPGNIRRGGSDPQYHRQLLAPPASMLQVARSRSCKLCAWQRRRCSSLLRKRLSRSIIYLDGLEAALRSGSKVPRLCYYAALQPHADSMIAIVQAATAAYSMLGHPLLARSHRPAAVPFTRDTSRSSSGTAATILEHNATSATTASGPRVPTRGARARRPSQAR